MTSQRKSAASRANGAKSQGPKTSETRQKSSHNSLSHGLTSKSTIVLKCENQAEFQKMIEDYAETYRPASPVEQDLVDEMVAAKWRIQRLRMIETSLLDIEMDAEIAQAETETPDPGRLLARAFRSLVDESRAISLASRYQSRLHRIHERSHSTLRELQQTRSRQTAEPAAPTPIQPGPPPTAEPKNDETNLSVVVSTLPPPAVPTTKPLSLLRHPKIRRIDNVRGFNSSTERGFNSSTERGFNSSTERGFNSSTVLPIRTKNLRFLGYRKIA